MIVCLGVSGPQGERGLPGPPGLPGMSPPEKKSAFAVELGQNNPEPDRPIVFHNIIYNEQQHFNETTGIFTCQVSGPYIFVYNLEANQNATAVLVKDTKGRFVDLIGGGSYKIQFSNKISGNIMFKLAEGDQVWLETKPGRNGLTEKSSLLGYILF